VVSVYPVSAKLRKFVRPANLPRKTCLSSVEFLLRSTARHGHLMQVAQSLGGQFTEEEAIILGHPAEVPNTELRGNLGDRRPRRISG